MAQGLRHARASAQGKEFGDKACLLQATQFVCPAQTRRACLEIVIGAGKPGQGGLDVCELKTLIVFPRPTKCDDKRLLQLVPRLVWGETQTVVRLAAIAMVRQRSHLMNA